MSDLEALRERFIAERPEYEQFAQAVHDRLLAELRAHELPAEVVHRTKEVYSLVKKAVLKQLPYEEIPDKAGVRVVYAYPVSLADLEDLLEDVFVIARREDKREGLEPHELRYLGVHYDVKFRRGDLRAPSGLGLDEPICEIQLHTRQQSVWAAYSHELLYKVPHDPPGNVKRSVHRLLALVEIFDEQVDAARQAIMNQPGYETARLLERLERTFFRLTARPYDPELSRLVLDAVVPIYAEAGQSAAGQLAEFLAKRATKLDELYVTYEGDERASPLLFQPEAFILFERLEEAPARLEAAFSAILPRELLVELADVWGSPIE